MKKLMMVIAAFALVTSAAAASFNWKWTSTLNNPSESAFSGTVYLFNAQDYSQQTILTAFLANPKSYALSGAITSRSTTDGKGSTAVSIPEADIGTLREVSASEKYVDFFYAAVFSSGDDNYIFLTDTYNNLVQSSQITSLSKSLGGSSVLTDTSTIASGKNWYKGAASPEPPVIPEPTTGLLVLLGVAGLALRRRHA